MARTFLNVGCGDKKIPGFINIDIGPGTDVRADVTKGLPFENNSVDGIFCEHFIEHLSQAEGAAFLRECRRVLVPGGILRIATADLDEVVRSYESGWRKQAWIRDFGYGWIDNRAEMMNIAMREWGHRWLYNEEELSRLAGYAGLSTPLRRKFGESDEPMLTGREYREDSKLIIEFMKQRRPDVAGDPLVSILIPAYNPRYFAFALESALAQTHRAVEIIVSDDCRTGEIENILTPYRKNDSRIKYAKNKKQGAFNNYLQCFTLAAGEFIKFLNDDDVLHPSCAERMLDCFKKYPDITLVTSHRQRIDAAGNPLPDTPPTERPVEQDSVISGASLAKALLERRINFIGEPSTAMFRKSDMAGAKPHFLSFADREVTWNVDVAIWLALLSKGDAVYLVDTLSSFRQHPEQEQAQDGAAERGRMAWEQLVFDGTRMGFFGPHAPRQIVTQSLRQDEASAPATPIAATERKKKVSIIIPVFNKVELTKKCLETLFTNTPDGLYEVIAVDNASSDGTREYLASLSNPAVRTIANERNLGFAKACNQGAAEASSDYLLFLNNDTEPQKGWLEPLLSVLDIDGSVAAAGSKLLFPNGTIQHGGVIIVENRKSHEPLVAVHNHYQKPSDLPDANRMHTYQVLTAASLLVRRTVFEQAGGFDEGYWNGYEDVDLCFTIRSLGWELVYQPQSVLIHHESQSGPERFTKVHQNIARLYEKWAGKIKPDVVVEEDGTIQAANRSGVRLYDAPAGPLPRRADVRKGRTSIIILTYNEVSCTKECVESIKRNTPEPHEIIFVDNGSSDGTVKWLRQFVKGEANCTLIENRENLGFAKGCNQGMAAATGEYLLLLNNDTVVTDGWLSGLLECLASGPDAGIVGPMTNNISGRQKVPVVGYRELSGLDEYARSFRERNRCRRIPSRRIVGFCMLFRRSLAETIGLLDERFGSGNYEDDDLCLRAALLGHRNLIAGDVFIHHYGSRSFIGNKINYSSALQRNETLYRNKWANADPAGALGRKLLALHSIDEAREHSLGGDLDRAVQTALNGIRHAPEHGDLYFAAAEMLLEAKQFTNALEALNELPAGAGEQRKLELMGYCHDGLGQLDEAAACADAALTGNSRSAPALNLKGVLSFRRQRPDEAMQWFRRALESDGSYGEAHTNLGVLAWSAGKKEEALDLFERGFRLSPTSGDIATSYQSAFTLLAQFERAEEAVREALALHAGSRRLRYMLIDILIHRNNAAGALAEMERAMALYGAAELLPFALEQRAFVGPKEIDGTGRKDATISLCMIVKNEEQHLARCLQSARPVADEIIVMDTGSTDRTKDIARACGAKVFDFAWTGSFAEARNASIERASGSWVLVLDADEVISPRDHEAIREAAGKNGAHRSACSLVTRNYVQSVHVTGWRANDGSAVEEAGTGWFPSEKVRLFPRDGRIRFENAVHELVEPSLARHKIKIRKIGVPVHHYGKLDEQKTKTKGEEYYLLGKKKLEEQGGDVDALSELAVQAGSLGRYEDAAELWARVIGQKPGAAAAHLNLGAACLELGRYGEALAATRRARELAPGMREAAYNHAVAALYGGDARTAVSLLEELLARTPDYAAATVMLAAARCCAGQGAGGQELFRSLRASGGGFAGSLAEFAGKLRAAGRADYAAALLDAAMEAGFDDQALSRLREECRPGAAACS